MKTTMIEYLPVADILKRLDLINELSDMPGDWHRGLMTAREIVKEMAKERRHGKGQED